ncbi:MAG: copper amine oxidase N-terminal domain-containing protein [Mycobacterium leprae]
MRRMGIWLLALLLALTVVQSPARAEGTSSTPSAASVQQLTDDQPVVVKGQLMYAVSAVAARLNGKLSWKNSNKTALIQTDRGSIELTVDSKNALVYGKTVALSTPVTVQSNRTLVPASFFLNFTDSLSAVYLGDKDPVALALLSTTGTALPKNVDIRLVARMSVHTTVPTRQSMQLILDGRAQARGADELISFQVVSPDALMGSTSGTVATKGGKTYVKVAGAPWEADTGSLSLFETLSSAAATPQTTAISDTESAQMLDELLSSAQLGSSRVVNGHTEQDVIVDLNPTMLDELTGAAMESAGTSGVSASQINIAWNVATMTLTVDQASGQISRLSLLFSAQVQTKIVGRMVPVGDMTLRLDLTIQPSDKPIVWPTDLPR